MRITDPDRLHADLRLALLGIHSPRLDMLTRDTGYDEALGIKCAGTPTCVMTHDTAPTP